MVTVKNIKTYSGVKEIRIRIDRQTIFGNPFFISSKVYRDEVCDSYEKWFYDQLVPGVNPEFVSELDKIYKIACVCDVALMCWCAPLRCHGETIASYLNKKLESEGLI